MRYSFVPTFGVGNAVIGAQDDVPVLEKAPKPLAVVLKTACMRAHVLQTSSRPLSHIRMFMGSIRSGGGLVEAARAIMPPITWAKFEM